MCVCVCVSDRDKERDIEREGDREVTVCWDGGAQLMVRPYFFLLTVKLQKSLLLFLVTWKQIIRHLSIQAHLI